MAVRVQTEITGPPGSPWLSTFIFNAASQAGAQDAVTAVGAFWVALRNYIRSGTTITTFQDVEQFDVSTGLNIGLFSTTGASTTGLDASQPLPPATQGLVRLRTGTFVDGREVRGRLFIPGPTEQYNTTGVVDSAYRDAVAAAASALRADANSEWAVYSPTHNVSPGIASTSVWNQWAVLRSRRD